MLFKQFWVRYLMSDCCVKLPRINLSLGGSTESQLREKSLKYARNFLKQQDEPKDLFELPAERSLQEINEESAESEQIDEADLMKDYICTEISERELSSAINNVREFPRLRHFQKPLVVFLDLSWMTWIKKSLKPFQRT